MIMHHKHIVVEDRCLLYIHVYELGVLSINSGTRVFMCLWQVIFLL